MEKSELPSEITVDERAGIERTVPGSSLPEGEFQTPKPHVVRTEVRRDVERTVESRPAARTVVPDFSTYTMSSEGSSNEGQFKTLQPDSRQQFDTLTSELTTGSISSADESSQRFKKLTPTDSTQPIKTYLVTIDGDLVSEHSDSDKSTKTGKKSKLHEDLSTYSVSSIDESMREHGITEDSLKTDQLSGLTKSSVTNMDEISEHSEESLPKSSLTNITSDPSLNSMTGVSTLSQYTFQTEDFSGVPDLTQYTFKSEDATGAPDLSQYSLKSADITGKSENKSSNAASGEGSDYLQQKFASLDNLISESKSLIAKHKVFVDKNKEMEEPPKEPPVEESSKKQAREVTPGVQGLSVGESNVKSRLFTVKSANSVTQINCCNNPKMLTATLP